MESGSGTLVIWSVEARCSFDQPRQVGDLLLGKKWTRIPFVEGSIGVPVGSSWDMPWLKLTGRLSYEAAQALRWWWLAQAGFQGRLGVETRLVREEVRYEFSVSRQASGFVEDEASTRWVSHLDGEAESSNQQRSGKDFGGDDDGNEEQPR